MARRQLLTDEQRYAYDCHARRAAWLGAYRSNGRLCLERRRAAAQGRLSTAQATRINARSLNVSFILIHEPDNFNTFVSSPLSDHHRNRLSLTGDGRLA